MMTAAIDILDKIEDCRNNMVMLAMQTSFTDKRVVEISVELDQLLNQLEQSK
ncbi:Spo0E family sporulation regulatory protein-aspartic acid phosphatase [Bacillus aerolatus]|uniref:Spo0E family sporulation regulatory protein-aspartic acid phosphatase n=1 Tax=Bacillus aerolatus TaxID=2653354 RepID=A0A6I1FKF4_9BACI|nr:aspartyl-phosphate phosphatase Spo0E family protein [Bacillus aerolatus]KAB7704112.1 Spo0E family sporulation regulatory protein-aspartic acid phosphatase [Bacillus aerolatus]